MALSEFESHHCNPSTSGFRDFCLIPTAQLCGASLGWRQRRGGSPWTRLSSLSPGLTLTMLTAFLPHLSAPANVPLPSQSLGNAHTPIPREDAGCWGGGTDIMGPLRLQSPSSQRGNPNQRPTTTTSISTAGTERTTRSPGTASAPMTNTRYLPVAFGLNRHPLFS